LGRNPEEKAGSIRERKASKPDAGGSISVKKGQEPAGERKTAGQETKSETKTEHKVEAPASSQGAQQPLAALEYKAPEPENKRGLELTPAEIDTVLAWEVPSRHTWINKLKEEDQFGKLIDCLKGRERVYRDPKERTAVESMAKDYAVVDGILVTRKPYGPEGELRLLAVVPNGFRTMLVSENHDRPEGGHRDYTTTLFLLRRFWFWKGMRADTQKFCDACILCALIHSGKGRGVMVGWGIEPPRLACVHADFCGPLQTTKRGNRYVFAIIDRATGWLEAHATIDAKAETAAQVLLNQWVPRYGCPRVVVTDNGRHFTADSFAEATRTLGMKLRHVTPYHPQANGMIERRFRDMGKILKIFGTTQKDWDEILPIFLLSTRNKVNRTSGYSPAMMLLGEELRLPNAIDCKVEIYEDQPTELQKLLVRKALVDKVVHERRRKLFEKSEEAAQQRLEAMDWRVGHQAFYYVSKRALGQNKKTTISWSGPLDVVEVRKHVGLASKRGKGHGEPDAMCCFERAKHTREGHERQGSG